jgi:hypothetical protein
LALAAVLVLTIVLPAAGQESPFKLEPAAPLVDQPFEVILAADAAEPPAGVRYEWFVHAKTAGTEVEPASAGVPDPLPNAPKLLIAKARINTTYRITLSRVAGGNEQVFPPLVVAFDDTKLVSAALAQPPMPAPMPMPPPPTNVPPAAAPLPSDPSPTEEIGQKLRSARIWAEGIATFPRGDNLVLPVEFFQAALYKPRQNGVSLRTRTQTPLLDAEELYRAMHGVATQAPEDATGEQIVAAWATAKGQFLAALENHGQTDKTIADWAAVTDEWQAEVLRVAPDRFREALIQGGLIFTAVLLEYEKQHIEAAMTTGARVGPGGTSGRGGTYVGTSGYVPTHAAVHHERVMSRIYRRHDRRMARIRGY